MIVNCEAFSRTQANVLNKLMHWEFCHHLIDSFFLSFLPSFFKTQINGSVPSQTTLGVTAPLTAVVKVDVTRQGLVLRGEVGSLVFKELPFHAVLILLLLPPNKERGGKLLHSAFSNVACVWICVWWWWWRRVQANSRWKKQKFSNHLHRLFSSSSFFLIFNCRASWISSFVFFGFLDTACSSSASSFFTVCDGQNGCECGRRRRELRSHWCVGGERPPSSQRRLPSPLSSFSSSLACHFFLPADFPYSSVFLSS